MFIGLNINILGSSNILSTDYINKSIENITETCSDIGIANKQILITDKNIFYRKFDDLKKNFFSFWINFYKKCY